MEGRLEIGRKKQGEREIEEAAAGRGPGRLGPDRQEAAALDQLRDDGPTSYLSKTWPGWTKADRAARQTEQARGSTSRRGHRKREQKGEKRKDAAGKRKNTATKKKEKKRERETEKRERKEKGDARQDKQRQDRRGAGGLSPPAKRRRSRLIGDEQKEEGGRKTGREGTKEKRGRGRAVQQEKGRGETPGQQLRQERPARTARTAALLSNGASRPRSARFQVCVPGTGQRFDGHLVARGAVALGS